MAKSYIQHFSKLSKEEKIKVLEGQSGIESLSEDLSSYWHSKNQKIFDEFSENTLSNYYLPFGIAPNFLINGRIYHLPMVVEESSVVAAASAAAKFWSQYGGFNAKVISTIKTGQVHFTWTGLYSDLTERFSVIKAELLNGTILITQNMEKRGGGIIDVELINYSDKIPNYYQLNVKFETVDSMGANFINSVLEQMAVTLKEYASLKLSEKGKLEIIMSILSNYTPKCLVGCSVEAPINTFDEIDGTTPAEIFIDKFITAVKIAEMDTYRAVTHNKGIMNGVDAIVLATGNDFRAVESAAHAFASRNGSYTSLSKAYITGNSLHFTLTIPLALGTVGGLTSLHPLAKKSLEILGNPDAKELMMIAASAGLANHFSAIKALVTGGIQKGHMKMHLNNILAQLNATDAQKVKALEWFKDKTVSLAGVREFLKNKNM
jgi:hydroxymethylglutaryl-CoA reductase